MIAKWAILFLIILEHGYCAVTLRGSSTGNSPQNVTQHSNLTALQMQLRSQESELVQLAQRFDSNEAMMDALQKDVEDTLRAARQLVDSGVSEAQKKIILIEERQKQVLVDLSTLKQHVVALQEAFRKNEDRMVQIELLQGLASNNSKHMEEAIKSILEILLPTKIDSGDQVAVVSSGKTYQVKEGDSLGKIAKANGTTVKAIKELNQLTKDTIIVGQVLVIP